MILVFVGAGGSAAVDSEQYPTTVEFFNRLPPEITQLPLFKHVCDFLKTQKEDGQRIDIEEVLWRLNDLQNYFSLSRNTNTIAGWSMAENRICQFDSNILPGGSKPFLGGINNISVNRLTPLQKRINDLVHDFYVERPNLDKLSDWIILLQQLEKHGAVIEIFTTNYDLVLETVIDAAGINVKTGRQSDSETRLDTTLWDTSSGLQRGHGLLTKLHGSVDWQRWNDTIICSRAYMGDQKKHALLYPGYKGEPNKEKPDEELFAKFHEHLRTVVQQATKALFIGFSFRDEYINGILSELQPEIPKFVINTDESYPTSLDFLKGCKHFGNGLTAETVEACLRSLYPQNTQEYDDSDFKANSAYLDTLPPTSSSQSPSTKES